MTHEAWVGQGGEDLGHDSRAAYRNRNLNFPTSESSRERALPTRLGGRCTWSLARLRHKDKDTHDGGALEDTADDPDPARDDDGELTTEQVGHLGDCEGTNEGAGRHGGDDGALGVGPGVAKGVLVGVIGEDAGHGRDVQTEEPTADTCE